MIHGSSIISYKIEGVYYTESVRDAFARISQYCDALYGDYKDPSKNTLICNGKMMIHDHLGHGYTSLNSIRKEYRSSLYDVLFNEGRYITVSTDHLVNTNAYGEMPVAQLPVDATLNNMITPTEPAMYDGKMAFDFAWLLGVMLVSGEYRTTPTISLYKIDEELNKYIQRMLNFINGVGHSGNLENPADSTNVLTSKGKNPRVTIVCGDNMYANNSHAKNIFLRLFEALNKSERKIPQEIFKEGKLIIMSFVSGIIDAIGTLKNISERKYDVALTLPSGIAQPLLYLLMNADIPATIEYGTLKNGAPSGKDTISFPFVYEFQKFSHSSMYEGKSIEDSNLWESRRDKLLTIDKLVLLEKENPEDVYEIDTASGTYTANGIQLKAGSNK